MNDLMTPFRMRKVMYNNDIFVNNLHSFSNFLNKHFLFKKKKKKQFYLKQFLN